MTSQVFSGVLNVVECARCGVHFGITSDFERRRRQDGNTFYCPSMHSNVYGDDELARTKRALEQAQRLSAINREQADYERKERKATERRLSAQRGVSKRMKNRAANGMCPCCRRSFAATRMAAHVRTKHPDFNKDSPA